MVVSLFAFQHSAYIYFVLNPAVARCADVPTAVPRRGEGFGRNDLPARCGPAGPRHPARRVSSRRRSPGQRQFELAARPRRLSRRLQSRRSLSAAIRAFNIRADLIRGSAAYSSSSGGMAGGEKGPPPPPQATARPGETPPSTGKPAGKSAEQSVLSSGKTSGKSTEQLKQNSGKSSGTVSDQTVQGSAKTGSKSEQTTQGSSKSSGKYGEQTSQGSGKSNGKFSESSSQASGKPSNKSSESVSISGKSGGKSFDQSVHGSTKHHANPIDHASQSSSKSSAKPGEQPSPKPPDKTSASSGDSKRLPSDQPQESPQRSPRHTKKSPPRGRDTMSLDAGDERKNGKKSRKVSAVKGLSADSESGVVPASVGTGEQALPNPEEDEGVQKVRALGRRTLQLCQRSDWVAVEQSMKGVERAALEAGIDSPLADVADEVSGAMGAESLFGEGRMDLSASLCWA